jgi:hypothetical protein
VLQVSQMHEAEPLAESANVRDLEQEPAAHLQHPAAGSEQRERLEAVLEHVQAEHQIGVAGGDLLEVRHEARPCGVLRRRRAARSGLHPERLELRPGAPESLERVAVVRADVDDAAARREVRLRPPERRPNPPAIGTHLLRAARSVVAAVRPGVEAGQRGLNRRRVGEQERAARAHDRAQPHPVTIADQNLDLGLVRG